MAFKNRVRGLRLRHVAGLAFLTLQLAAIGWARFIPEKFFCWAPYDEGARYRISVNLDGRTLSVAEVADRYRYPSAGWEPRSIHNLISMVCQYESTYGADDDAQVLIRYDRNGRPEQTWIWR